MQYFEISLQLNYTTFFFPFAINPKVPTQFRNYSLDKLATFFSYFNDETWGLAVQWQYSYSNKCWNVKRRNVVGVSSSCIGKVKFRLCSKNCLSSSLSLGDFNMSYLDPKDTNNLCEPTNQNYQTTNQNYQTTNQIVTDLRVC